MSERVELDKVISKITPVTGEAGSDLPGPFTKAIALFGETLGFAVGLFAECSELWDVFAHIFADERAASAKRNSGTVTDCQQLRVRYYHHIIEHWGSLAAREQVRLRLAVARDLAGPESFYYAMVQSSLIPLRHSHSLADPLATADSRAEKPKPIIGLFAPSLSYRSRSRAACIV